MAIDAHNASNSGCQVELKEFDLASDPANAAAMAQQIADDPSIVGVVGPTFSDEMKSAGPILNTAGVATLTPSATGADLAKNGWTNFFRGRCQRLHPGIRARWLPGDHRELLQGVRAERRLRLREGVGGLGHDRTGRFGGTRMLGDRAEAQPDLKAVAEKINAESPDAVYYAGFYPQSAPLLAQLRATGVTAAFVSSDGSNVQAFVDRSTPPPTGQPCRVAVRPLRRRLPTRLLAAVNHQPGAYATESYDLATILLKGIDCGQGRPILMLEFVRSYDAAGLARTYQWDAEGELASPPIWIYQVQ